MSAEDTTVASITTRYLRVDQAEDAGPFGLGHGPGAVAALVVLVAGFVLIGGGNLDPGPEDAKLGMAAGEALGPIGQVFGHWEPALWFGRVAPSWLWARGEGGTPTSASIRWPAAIAAILLGGIVARRV